MDILNYFKVIKKNTNKWQCICPAHNDKTASLTISIKDGKYLIYCHAGCDVNNILGLVGLSSADLFLNKKTKYDNIEKIYQYKDENGKVVHETVRLIGKRFYQRVPLSDGTYQNSLKGIEPIIYNLQNVLKSDEVFVVEGEKDADNLIALGLVATTSPMGTKWRKSFNKYFVNVNSIVIIPDNDDAGKSHSKVIANNLKGRTKIINLHGLAEKEDVSDFLVNHTKDELLEIVKNTDYINAYYQYRAKDQIKINTSLLAKYLHEDSKERIVFDQSNIFKYEKGHYKMIDDLELEKVINSYIPEEIRNSHYIRETKGSFLRYSACITVNELKQNNQIINCKNTMISFDNGQIKQNIHSPNIFTVNQIKYSYVENGNCEKFNKFLKDVLDDDQIHLIQEVLGYLLIPNNSIKKFFVFLGKKDCGKSVLLNVIKNLIGIDYISTKNLQSICNPELRFVTSMLYGKLVNISGDLPEKMLMDLGTLKQLTGGDLIDAEFKGGKCFSFKNTSRLIFSANKMPLTANKDDAFYERLLIIPFNKVVPLEKQIMDIDNTFNYDKILSWCIAGLNRLITNNFSLSISDKNIKELNLYVLDNSSVLTFLDEECEICTDFKIPVRGLYSAYKEFCKDNGCMPVSNKKFKHEIINYYKGKVVYKVIRLSDSTAKAYVGIKLNTFVT